MEAYLAMRIEQGKLDYLAVVTRYPQFKDGIDDILIADGYQDLIVAQVAIGQNTVTFTKA